MPDLFGTLCITPQGEVINPAGRRFRQLTCGVRGDFDILDFVVRNQGFVSIRLKEDRIVIRLRAGLISARTLETVAKFLTARPAPEIEVDCVGKVAVHLKNDDTLMFRLGSLVKRN